MCFHFFNSDGCFSDYDYVYQSRFQVSQTRKFSSISNHYFFIINSKLDNTLQSRGANRLRGCLRQIDATNIDCQNEQFLGPSIHSCLLANRFKTDQILVKTAIFGPFDQNISKHMPDPSADTLAEND